MYLLMWIVHLFDPFVSWILVPVFVYTRLSEVAVQSFLIESVGSQIETVTSWGNTVNTIYNYMQV